MKTLLQLICALLGWQASVFSFISSRLYCWSIEIDRKYDLGYWGEGDD